jgi:capsular polysaccharide biosynthesis protein
LDRSRIFNVAVAEAATVPAVPSRSRGMTLLLGFLAAIAIGLAAAAAAEHLNPSLRTSEEVRELLDVPVLASVPTID